MGLAARLRVPMSCETRRAAHPPLAQKPNGALNGRPPLRCCSSGNNAYLDQQNLEPWPSYNDSQSSRASSIGERRAPCMRPRCVARRQAVKVGQRAADVALMRLVLYAWKSSSRCSNANDVAPVAAVRLLGIATVRRHQRQALHVWVLRTLSAKAELARSSLAGQVLEYQAEVAEAREAERLSEEQARAAAAAHTAAVTALVEVNAEATHKHALMAATFEALQAASLRLIASRAAHRQERLALQMWILHAQAAKLRQLATLHSCRRGLRQAMDKLHDEQLSRGGPQVERAVALRWLERHSQVDRLRTMLCTWAVAAHRSQASVTVMRQAERNLLQRSLGTWRRRAMVQPLPELTVALRALAMHGRRRKQRLSLHHWALLVARASAQRSARANHVLVARAAAAARASSRQRAASARSSCAVIVALALALLALVSLCAPPAASRSLLSAANVEAAPQHTPCTHMCHMIEDDSESPALRASLSSHSPLLLQLPAVEDNGAAQRPSPSSSSAAQAPARSSVLGVCRWNWARLHCESSTSATRPCKLGLKLLRPSRLLLPKAWQLCHERRAE